MPYFGKFLYISHKVTLVLVARLIESCFLCFFSMKQIKDIAKEEPTFSLYPLQPFLKIFSILINNARPQMKLLSYFYFIFLQINYLKRHFNLIAIFPPLKVKREERSTILLVLSNCLEITGR